MPHLLRWMLSGIWKRVLVSSGGARVGRVAPLWIDLRALRRLPTWTWMWASGETKPFYPRSGTAAITTISVTRADISPSNRANARRRWPNAGWRSTVEPIQLPMALWLKTATKALVVQPLGARLRRRTWRTKVRCQSLAPKWTSADPSIDTEKHKLTLESTKTSTNLPWKTLICKTVNRGQRNMNNWSIELKKWSLVDSSSRNQKFKTKMIWFLKSPCTWIDRVSKRWGIKN